jgi:transcriptional regulator with XRE-family HTH domain
MAKFDGALLRILREKQKLTVADLARLTERDYKTIAGCERNERRPSLELVERLCWALDCGAGELFTPGSDDDDRPTDLGAETDAWIARTLADAPPLTQRQAAKVSRALFAQVQS